MMKLGVDRIGADQIPIDVHVDGSGQFSAEFDEARYEASTRKELLEKLEKAVKQARDTHPVDVTVLGLVPAAKNRTGWSLDGPFDAGAGVVHAKLRGKHQREYNAWLMVSEGFDQKKFKYSSSRREAVQLARRLTPEEVREYMELRDACQKADSALDDFVVKVQIDPEDALREARRRG